MSDPISRSDAIGAKPEYRNEDMLDKEKSTYNKGWNDCNDAWVAIIKALPSAEGGDAEMNEVKSPYMQPSPESGADYISRADAIEELCTMMVDCFDADEEVIDAIRTTMNEISSAEAAQGWIPCSERLPKKGEVVLITNGKGNVRCGQYRSEHDVRGGTHYWWWKGKTIESVLAWMPLPKPYREDGEAE